MYGHVGMPAAYPPQLLDAYVAVARRRPRGSLSATALRTRSVAARRLLAHAAAGSSVSLERLLLAARTRNKGPGAIPASQTNPLAIAELASVIALQEALPEDQIDGLALYELALDLFGADRIHPEHQGVHAQLAYHLDRGRAAQLVELFNGLPDHVREDMPVDLANPFVGSPMRDDAVWLCGFQRLLPEPYPTLTDHAALAPFDRLTAVASKAKDVSDRVTVIVTSFRPGPYLTTAVRSLIEQSWTNLEILIIDDASPPEFDPVLRQCADLDVRVKLIKLAANAGTYAARNAGLNVASGRFVTFQDSDDWSHPRRLEMQVQPLLHDRSLVATISDGLRVSEDLVLTKPGRNPRVMNTSSIMFRRHEVIGHIGYFDSVRKAADSEYVKRIGAAYGASAVQRLGGATYALVRQAADSLSRAEIRVGWMDPARNAYRSAYELWHQQIKAGEANPYLRKDVSDRPFAAPARLTIEGGVPTKYDVVLVNDWRTQGGIQLAMVDEVRALTRHGVRVAIMQMESFRLMTPYLKAHCRPVQELINANIVDEVLPNDSVETELLVIQHPQLLLFETAAPSNVRPSRVVIVASKAPSWRDGRDNRYAPQVCTESARRLFGIEPVWCPHGPGLREILEGEPGKVALTSFDVGSVIDSDEWTVLRDGFRSDRPVIGRHTVDTAGKWPADRDTLLEAYPDSLDVDVRILGGAGTARALLGTPNFPPNWVVYGHDEVSVRSFLFQLDFYVYFPHPNALEVPGRAVLEAIASGCVAILPHDFSQALGSAAVFCEPADVQSNVRRYYSSLDLFLEQSRRGQERVRRDFGLDSYFRRIASLMTDVVGV